MTFVVINEKAEDSFVKHVMDYMNSSVGVFRTLQISQKVIKLGSEVVRAFGRVPSIVFNRLDHNLGVSIGALGLPRIPATTIAAISSLSHLREGPDVHFFRRVIVAVRDAMDAIATCGYASMFISGSLVLRPVAQATEMVHDCADLHLSYADYNTAFVRETEATGDAKLALAHTKRYNLLRVLKAVVSLATGILGLILLATGVTLFPAIALILIFMTSTIFAIVRDLHKESGRFKVIDFGKRGI